MHSRSLLLGILLSLLPFSASAHGAIQKVVEGKYLLNFTGVPLAPVAGKPQNNTLAISDVRTNSLVAEDVLFSIQITKDGNTFYTAQNQVATGGLLGFSFTYPEPGIYELFADFSLPGNPYLYEPEDIWIEVVAAPVQNRTTPLVIVGTIMGFVIGRGSMRRLTANA